MNIALFASGAGSNVYNIIHYFKQNEGINVVAVLSNKKDAGALGHADDAGVPTFSFTKDEFSSSNKVDEFLNERKVDFLVLAGFLLKVPQRLISCYPNKIINIHPALLPNYGGKGMYGMKIHNAVIKARESKSGITIHLVNEHYDEGAQIDQFECSVNGSDTVQTLAKKISVLEKAHFAKTIEKYIIQP